MASLRKRLAFGAGSRQLADVRTAPPAGAPGKKKLAKRLARDAARIGDLQERLYAESTAGGRRSLLLVLQGIDTAGKGGVTEHVVGACGPIGVEYTAFKRPTDEEAAHDFLWRIRRRAPAPGVVAVFDRSHYEDVIVPLVHHDISEGGLQERYDAINGFEQDLVDAGTTVLKCFLHISYGTQRERLLARLDNPDKHWKFNPGDLDERALWPDYQRAYQAMLQRCDTAAAPWYVVPADSKAYRNWAVGRLLRETLESLRPRYPAVELDVPALRQRLQPPH